MTNSEKIIRKTNPLFGIVLAILFVTLGLYLFFVKSEESGIDNPDLIKIACAASVVFFGGFLLFAVYRKIRRN